MGCHALLQQIFPTQGSNPGPRYCRQILYHLSHLGSLYIYTHTHTHYIFLYKTRMTHAVLKHAFVTKISGTSLENKKQVRVLPTLGWVGLALSLPRKLGTSSTQEGHGQERKPRNEPGCVRCLSPCAHSPSYACHIQITPSGPCSLCLSPLPHFSSQKQVRGYVASAQQRAKPMGDPNVKTLILQSGQSLHRQAEPAECP